MLCLSGFELYSRWVPLTQCLQFFNTPTCVPNEVALSQKATGLCVVKTLVSLGCYNFGRSCSKGG